MKMKEMVHCLSPLIPLLLSSSLVKGSVVVEGVNHGNKLIHWLKERGGYVNDKIEIRRNDPSDTTSGYGVFATSDLKSKETVLIIPVNSLLIARKEEDGNKEEEDEEDEEDEEEDSAMNCRLVKKLIQEMKLGDDSDYAPYVNYLISEPWGQLPSAWSDAGRAMVIDMLEKYTIDPIPPIEPEDWLDEWYDVCKGSKDPFEENAALMVVQRAWDNVLVPVFDMMSHRNGRWLNTDSNSVHADEDVVVKTERVVLAGEQLYTSYNMCRDCGNRKETYGTPEVFRDYGFIEEYPQRWIFPDAIGFIIDEKKEGSGILELKWTNHKPTIQDVDGLKDVQEGMKIFAQTKLNNPSKFIPNNEIDTIRKYHKALTRATDIALKIAYTDDEACKSNDNVCVVPSTRYDNLREDNTIEYNVKTCHIDEIMQFNEYVDKEETQTQYQLINVMHNPANKDTCFDLDGTVQICANYRPHYHEMSVHYAARYLPTIKRVLFVGGGDSMLLHEILQYSSIESVVGLELDQKVVRTSFKYFGTQPHWDNDKVEWWFGDATKSLLMLPKDYFGSFDLVLVDLSETVMSFKVTDKLDIVEVLSLLLTPDGIMLKNELYFDDMNDIFAHTVQYFYDGVPTICSQSMVLGSHSVDFFRQDNLTDHTVNNLLIGPLDFEKHFALYHDYAWKPDNRNKQCMRENDILDQVPATQQSSPGILMIVEAEDASLKLGSSEEMSNFVAETLNKESFTVISKIVSGSGSDDKVCAVVMNEGYVVSQYWADFNYYGFDIYLWGSFGGHERLKKALILAVGSSGHSSSSYRIVTGGMFGINTWRNDEETRGPRRTHMCDHSEPHIPNTKTNIDAIDTIIEESTTFIEQNATVLVICGFDNLEQCKSLETLRQKSKIENVIHLLSCNDVKEFEYNAASQIYSCERQLVEEIRKKIYPNKIDAIVFDQTMTYSMGQVLVRIFKNLKTQVEFLSKHPTVMAIYHDETKKNLWFSNLVNRFRTDIIIYEPVFKADILVEGTNMKISGHYVLTNERSILLLRELSTSIEDKTGARVVVKQVLGGTPNFDPDFSPNREYRPNEYDQTSSLEQMLSQRPLEHQTIFQLEEDTSNNDIMQRKDSTLSKVEVRKAVEQTLASVHSTHFTSDSARVDEFSNLGDGCLIVAIWPGGRVVVIWDGKQHIDINLSSREGSKSYFDVFEKKFIELLPSVKTILRDEQPRGYGRVINFPKDIKKKSELLWA